MDRKWRPRLARLFNYTRIYYVTADAGAPSSDHRGNVDIQRRLATNAKRMWQCRCERSESKHIVGMFPCLAQTKKMKIVRFSEVGSTPNVHPLYIYRRNADVANQIFEK